MAELERIFSPEARIGGALCLDFVNTAEWRTSDHPSDRLQTYDDLLLWAELGDLVSKTQAGRLRNHAREHPHEAVQMLHRARTVREALYGIFVAGMRREEPEPNDLALFNNELAAALAHAVLVRASGRYSWDWDWRPGNDHLDAVLWQVMWSAADLLTSPLHAKVRQCANEPCGWIFLDESKNGSRRWCSMALCGSRAKMRDYYWRKQGRTVADAHLEI